jgi:hypothetical protein
VAQVVFAHQITSGVGDILDVDVEGHLVQEVDSL